MRKLMKITFFLCLLLLFSPKLNPIGFSSFIASLGKNELSNHSLPVCWAQQPKKESPVVFKESLRPQPPQDYVVGKGDILEIFVWRNEQISRQLLVRPDGKISLPLLQDIQADGLTVLQLQGEITQRFSEHIEKPKVTVIVVEMGSYKVSVLGRVETPGVYPITGQTTIVEAIALAGGFTEWANKRNITVVTHQNGKEKKVTVNYKKIASGKDPSQNIILKRGDIIIVP